MTPSFTVTAMGLNVNLDDGQVRANEYPIISNSLGILGKRIPSITFVKIHRSHYWFSFE